MYYRIVYTGQHCDRGFCTLATIVIEDFVKWPSLILRIVHIGHHCDTGLCTLAIIVLEDCVHWPSL